MNGESVDNDHQYLTCWKDIANYLGKSVRTVQRWEQDFGLPVRRPNGIHYKSAVLAHAADLDAWLGSQWSERKRKNSGNEAPRLQMAQLIQASRELRSAHLALVEETSAALELLVESCRQLETTKYDKNGTPPPRWRFHKGDFNGVIARIQAPISAQYES